VEEAKNNSVTIGTRKVIALNELPEVRPVTGQADIYKFGSDDFYPNDLVKVINNSSSAKNSLRKLQSYIVGNGFTNVALNTQGINGRTYKDLLTEMAYQTALFEAVALRVVYGKATKVDANGERLIVDGEIVFQPIVLSVEVLSIEKVRKRKDGKIVYNPNRQYDNSKKYDVIYPAFEAMSDAELLAFVDSQNKLKPEEKGMVLYSMMRQPQADIYPLPAWAANKEAVESQGHIFSLLKGELQNGFYPSLIVTVAGDPHESYLTENGAEGKEGDSFVKQVKDGIRANTGAADGGNVVVFAQSNPDMKINFEQLNSNAKTEELVALSDGINQMIATIFNIPLSLANVATAGQLGSNQQMRLEIDWFNDSLSVFRDFLTNLFATVLPMVDWSITPKNPFMAIDPALEKVLTANEIREMFGFEPLQIEPNESV
jgi:hypothetical protein